MILRASLSCLSCSYLVYSDVQLNNIAVKAKWIKSQVIQSIQVFVPNSLSVYINLLSSNGLSVDILIWFHIVKVLWICQ